MLIFLKYFFISPLHTVLQLFYHQVVNCSSWEPCDFTSCILNVRVTFCMNFLWHTATKVKYRNKCHCWKCFSQKSWSYWFTWKRNIFKDMVSRIICPYLLIYRTDSNKNAFGKRKFPGNLSTENFRNVYTENWGTEILRTIPMIR